jgi:hypothetical protein
MRSILRDQGAAVVVGTASFSVSLLAIGLAFVALRSICLSYIAFGLAAFLLAITGYFFIVLLRHHSKTKRYIQQIAIFLSEGRKLRGELLSIHEIPQWTVEMKNKVPQWKAEVQKWLDENLPEHASEFDLEGIITTLETVGVNADAGQAAEHLEGRMQNLKEILRDIRM